MKAKFLCNNVTDHGNNCKNVNLTAVYAGSKNEEDNQFSAATPSGVLDNADSMALNHQIMKLAAIYNVWDGVELLRGSMLCLKDEVDLFIIVYQEKSNFHEQYNPLPDMDLSGFNHIVLHKYEPETPGGGTNERNKRNIGLDIARREGCTHFLHVDTDEYYDNFAEAKRFYTESGKEGSVCALLTYFKLPTLRFENPDGYYVPFIHKLKPETAAGGRNYPYYVDPTRRINTNDVALLPVFMHHMSWVRLDIARKCRNSSARSHIEKGTMLKDYHSEDVKSGFYVKDYQQKLVEVPDVFKISVVMTGFEPAGD